MSEHEPTIRKARSSAGTITHLFPDNRECTVSFDDGWSVVEYDDNEPAVGSTSRFRVTRHLEMNTNEDKERSVAVGSNSGLIQTGDHAVVTFMGIAGPTPHSDSSAHRTAIIVALIAAGATVLAALISLIGVLLST